MNATERRSIERIIRGRFELLASELDHLASEYQQQVQKDVTARYAKELEAAAQAQAQLQATATKLNTEAQKLVDKLKAKGIEPHDRYGNQTIKVFEVNDRIEWQPTGMTREKTQATQEVANRLRLAKNNLRREELDLLEKLHRTTIESGDAEEFLLEMPTAEDLMVKAAEPKKALSSG